MPSKPVPNLDRQTVASFGDEWSRVDQMEMGGAEAGAIFDEYVATFPSKSLPGHYRAHNAYTMRTDARDRLGTPLEKRFHKHATTAMIESAGLFPIVFSVRAPYCHAVAHES